MWKGGKFEDIQRIGFQYIWQALQHLGIYGTNLNYDISS